MRVPQCQHVIWIDCNPQAGAEMRDLLPLLMLPPQAFKERTGLVIGLPMLTAAYNATDSFALAVQGRTWQSAAVQTQRPFQRQSTTCALSLSALHRSQCQRHRSGG